MTLMKIQSDKEYVIEEKLLRFSVDYAATGNTVAAATLLDLKKSIEKLERFRDWTFIATVPKRKKFIDGPCCPQMVLGKVGDVLAVQYAQSDLQADSDDAHNFNEVASPNGKRLYVDGKIDWTARCHFWVPADVINTEEVRESVAATSHTNPHNSPSAKVRELAQKWQIPTTNS